MVGGSPPVIPPDPDLFVQGCHGPPADDCRAFGLERHRRDPPSSARTESADDGIIIAPMLGKLMETVRPTAADAPHRFDPTLLREYEVRGVVGQRLSLGAARAGGGGSGTGPGRRRARMGAGA